MAIEAGNGQHGGVPVLGSSHAGRAARRVVAAVAAAAAVLAVLVPAVGAAALEWNIARVGAPVSAGGSVIAVVDTGVDAKHPAFGNRVLPSIDIVAGSGDPNGHGTHVAGTAAGGVIDCGSGPSAIGVAPASKILPVRVLDAEGRGTIDGVAEGIRRAADRGAQVINLSLGPEFSLGDVGGTSSALAEAIEYAWAKGSIPVIVAGNGALTGALLGSGYGDLPAVVVTAVDHRDNRPGYASSVGSAKWGITAPGGAGTGRSGEDVLSAYPNQRCALLAGTSMAAPHVSGALAILRAKGLGQQAAVDRILATADPIGSRSTFGAGLLNVRAATSGLQRSAPTTPTSSTAPTTEPPRRTDRVTTTTAPSPTSAAPSTSSAPSTSPSTTNQGAPSSSVTEPAPESSSTPTGGSAASDSGTVPSDLDGRAAGVTLDVEDDDRTGPGLVAAAGLACVGAWALLGRVALGQRRG